MKKLLQSSSLNMKLFSFRPRPSQPQTSSVQRSRSHIRCVRCVSSNAAGSIAAEQPYHKLSLEEVLANVRRALRGNNALDQTNTSAMAFGVGTHMGCDVSWTFIWRPDGAFYEEVRSQHLTYKWGFDGGSNSHCWEEVKPGRSTTAATKTKITSISSNCMHTDNRTARVSSTYHRSSVNSSTSDADAFIRGLRGAWMVDPTGVSKVLEYDDHEAALLGAIIKGGSWLVPALAQERLDVELEGKEGSSSQLWKQYKPELNMPPVAYTVEHPQTPVAAAASHSSANSSRKHSRRRQQPPVDGCPDEQQQQQQLGMQLLQQQMQQTHQQHQTAWDIAVTEQQQRHDYASGSSSRSGQVGHVVAATTAQQQQQQQPSQSRGTHGRHAHDLAVAIKLKGGRMLARIEIDPDTWHVRKSSHPLCSESEYWKFNDWHNWANSRQSSCNSSSSSSGGTALDVMYPKEVHHVLFQGCTHKYITLGAQARGVDIHRAYQLPASPPVPVDAQYLDIYSSQVPVWQTMTGHLLAECHINGRRAGWMILDTGASGFVIEPAVADQYELPRFGDLRIAGVAGKVKTRFRKASQLRIGPLLLSDPVLMEMCASKLVSGFHDRVVGIAGFDVFRRCRMVLPCQQTRRHLIKASSSVGQVRPYVQSGTDSSSMQAVQWPPSAATAQQLAQVAAVQQQLVALNHSTADASPAAAAMEQQEQHKRVQVGLRRRSRPAASASAAWRQDALNTLLELQDPITAVQNRPTAAAAAATAASQSSSSSSTSSSRFSKRRRRSSSNTGATTSAAVGSSSSSIVADGTSDHHHQQQHVGQFVVPPLIETRENKLPPYGNRLVEMLLQRPELLKGPHQLGDGYVWQNVVMIASLPHVELEFISPGTGKRHRSLFMVDTGAAGSEVMFHSRASRELKLLDAPSNKQRGEEEEQRFISGVDNDKTTSANQLPQLAVQAGQLPELVIHGQAGSNPNASGSLVMHNVNALFSKTGGLDISLYSAGMVCIDLLARMEVVIDYPNKKIGWKIPVAAAQSQQQQQQQQ